MCKNSVIVIGGNKGGVGKSTVADGAIDVLSNAGKKVFVIDCDDEISDVGKAHQNSGIECVLRPLANEEDVMKFGRLIEKNSDACIVVNTPGGGELTKYIMWIVDLCRELARELLIIWPINTGIDSLNVARRCQKECDGIPFVVVRNLKFGKNGSPDNFELFNEHKFKESVKTVDFPILHQELMDKIVNNRLNFSNASEALDKEGQPLFYVIEKSMIRRFRSEIAKSLGGLFGLETETQND